MNTKKFGYVRVISKDQNEGKQIASMKEQGIEERDMLYIHSLDRFGRNKDEILNEWQEITKQIKADIIVLDMPLLDTTKYKDSMGSFISDLVLQILSWMAQEERERIRKRQREGIDVALKNGVQFGRPQAEPTPEFQTAYKKWKAGEITATAAIEEAGMKRTTFYKLLKKMKAEEQEA
ncbi:recombinase family protein [Virgibacillus halodenitrificans]|uniref:recombinase family protein n=1 Tax=Virgibacillus halodenitrificans TaxID=1482 RepID=UPI000301EC26|nr:recombinase family protein [Virgibacillus halodenitrificans]